MTAAEMVNFVLDTIDAVGVPDIEWLINYVYHHQVNGFWSRDEVRGFVRVAQSQL